MRLFLSLICGLCAYLSLVGSAQANSRFEIKQLVIQETLNTDVPVSLALAVAKVESDFNAKALSSVGARGVMQIMPKTARGEFGVSADQLWDAELNIRIGVAFLKQLHEQYDGRWELALSHYNGGTIKGNQPHKYTRKYVQKVMKWQKVYQEQETLWAQNEREDINKYEDWDEGVELSEWKRFRDDDWDEPSFEPTRIIIVERDRPRSVQRRQPFGPFDDFGYRRPPPPRYFR